MRLKNFEHKTIVLKEFNIKYLKTLNLFYIFLVFLVFLTLTKKFNLFLNKTTNNKNILFIFFHSLKSF